jgi:hypothetical protein
LRRHHDILEESISGSDESSTTFKSPVSQTTISREDDNSIGTPSAQPDAGSTKPPKLPRDERVTSFLWEPCKRYPIIAGSEFSLTQSSMDSPLAAQSFVRLPHTLDYCPVVAGALRDSSSTIETTAAS